MLSISRITPQQWEVGKTIRLAALKEAPYAFGTRYEDAVLRPEQEWRNSATERALSANSATFLAFVGEEAVGIAGGYRDDASQKTVDLVSVWIAPEWRGAGIIDPLIETVCHWAQSVGAMRISAWVTEGNDRALRVYNRQGFITQSDRHPYPANPDLYEILTVRPLNEIE
jgi:GNAT superfamily N-acetyltransferase